MINANLPQETITLILLPQREKFVELMNNEEYHKSLLHAGVNHTLSQIRTKYWIVRGRVEVENVLRKCKTCHKHQGGPSQDPHFSNILAWTTLDPCILNWRIGRRKRYGSAYSVVIHFDNLNSAALL